MIVWNYRRRVGGLAIRGGRKMFLHLFDLLKSNTEVSGLWFFRLLNDLTEIGRAHV